MTTTYTGTDATDAYLNAIGRLPLLSAEQERTASRDQLIAHNLRLVVSIAKGYRNRGMELDDLIQEGNLGLLRAASDFDADRGIRFSTYATNWIRQHITRALDNKARAIRLPVHMGQSITTLRRAVADHMLEGETVPTVSELAARLGWSVDKVVRTLTVIDAPLSLDKKEHTSTVAFGSERTLADLIPAPPVEYSARVEREQLRAHLDALLAELEPREAAVIRARHEQDRTLDDIGHEIGVTRERVRQIELVAMTKLRQHRDGLACWMEG